MVISTAADPGRGPGCSQSCAVTTSPTPPPGQPVGTVSTVGAMGPPVRAPGRVTRGAKVMVSGKASGALPGSLASSPQGDRLLGCHTAADRGGWGCGGSAAIWEASGLGEQLRRRGKQRAPGEQPAGPGMSSGGHPVSWLGQPHRPGWGRRGARMSRAGLQPWAWRGARLGRAHAGQPGARQRARGQQQLFLGLSLGVSLMESVK